MNRLLFVLLLGSIGGGTAFAQSLSDNLYAYWPFDETEGTVVPNLAGDGIPGTAVNDPLWVVDEGRTALSFDRTLSTYVETGVSVPALTVADDDFTWSYWAKNGEGNGNNDVIFGNRFCGDADCDPRQFIKFTPTRFEYDRLDSGTEDITYTAPMEANGPWIHHLVTKTGPELAYYRDGVFDASVTLDPTPDFADPQPVFFAGDRERENWTGLIDDAALWDRALSEGEILTIFGAGTDGVGSLLDATGPIIPPIAGRGTIGSTTVASTVVEESLEFGDPTTGPGLAQEWYADGNPGSKEGVDAIFDGGLPVVPAFRSSGGSWWAGSGTLGDLQKYPPEVQPALNNNYSVRSTGEILIEESGVYTRSRTVSMTIPISRSISTRVVSLAIQLRKY